MKNGLLIRYTYTALLILTPGFANADVISCLNSAKQSERYVRCINTTDDKTACDAAATAYCRNQQTSAIDTNNDVIIQQNTINNNVVVEPQNPVGEGKHDIKARKGGKTIKPVQNNKVQNLPQNKGAAIQSHPKVPAGGRR